MNVERTQPYSEDAEKGLLGSMLQQSDVIGEFVEAGGTEAWFDYPAHQTIYSTLLECWSCDKRADLIIVTNLLRDRKKLDEVGGVFYVSSLIGYTPTAANAAYYLEIVREKFVLRQLIRHGTSFVERAHVDGSSAMVQLDEAEASIMSIRARVDGAQVETTMQADVMEAIETIERLYENRGAVMGLPTGFTQLDRMTGGLQAPDMIVIAGRPSMGKTAFAMNIAEHVAIVAQKNVGIFSLEMSRQQLVQRLLSSRARVNLQKVRDGYLSERDFPALTTASSKLAASGIHIDDTGGLTINALRAKARRWRQKHGIALIVIDYLQLMRATSHQAQNNREREVAEISSGIKGLAKELGIPVIVLAQINRNAEKREHGKPKLSDLRESGSIEQDADMVGLLWRAEYYEEDEEKKEELRGEAELIIAKQRNGPTGDVKLTFLKEFTRFEVRASEAVQASWLPHSN